MIQFMSYNKNNKSEFNFANGVHHEFLYSFARYTDLPSPFPGTKYYYTARPLVLFPVLFFYA